MPFNRFNELPEYQDHISTYIPLPLDDIMRMGAMKQKKFDDDQEEIKATQDLIKINADPHRRAVRDQLLQSYNNEITDLADQYVKTGDPALASKVRDVKRRFANDQVRLGLESSYQAHQQYLKDREASIKEGKYAGDIYGSAYDPYAYDKEYTSTEGFKPFDYQGMYNKQDYRTVGQSLINDIAKDSTAWDGIKINKQTGMPDVGAYGQYWKNSSSKSGVSEPKVLKIARTNAENLLKDPKAGAWFVDETINKYKPGIGHVDYQSLPEDLQDLIKKEATDYLFSLGAKQIGLDTKAGNDISFIPGSDKLTEENGAVPVYTTPATDIKGTDYGSNFDIIKSGQSIPFNKEEIKKIYERYNIPLDKNGNPKIGGRNLESAQAEIAVGKSNLKDTYQDIDKLPDYAKDFALSSLKVIDKNLYNKVNNGGKLTEQEKAKVYPQLKIISEVAKQDLLQSSTSVGLTPKEAQIVNLDLFSNKSDGPNTVKHLGTGQAGNVRFFDKEEGKVITLSELKDKHDTNETVSVRGKLTADNPYSFITNDDQFADAKQLFIGGKEYIVSGPKQYIDPKTGSSNIPENHKLQRTKIANDIYKTKFSVIPQEKNIYGKNIVVGFKPYDNTDRSKGEFIVIDNNISKSFKTAQEAEDYILNNAIESQSK